MKALKTLGKVMIGVAIVALVGLMLVGEVRNFNHGVCVNCGTAYKAIDTTRHGQTVYICPNCHHKAYK